MRIISKRALREFWLENDRTKDVLEDWYRTVKEADWRNFADLRQTFRHADIFGDCTIFDVGGNKLRIIAKVRYQKYKVFISFVLHHSEYDKGAWKNVC